MLSSKLNEVITYNLSLLCDQEITTTASVVAHRHSQGCRCTPRLEKEFGAEFMGVSSKCIPRGDSSYFLLGIEGCGI